jgi:hypothetical protein
MISVAPFAIPLVVDLDGTLLLSDLLLETTALLMREQTWKFPALLPWLARGKPHLKHRLALSTDLDVQTLDSNSTTAPHGMSASARSKDVHRAKMALIAPEIAPFLSSHLA